jgi:hypothetical protein
MLRIPQSRVVLAGRIECQIGTTARAGCPLADKFATLTLPPGMDSNSRREQVRSKKRVYVFLPPARAFSVLLLKKFCGHYSGRSSKGVFTKFNRRIAPVKPPPLLTEETKYLMAGKAEGTDVQHLT